MRWTYGAKLVAAVAGLALGTQAADSYPWRDPETGFLFSQYNAAYQIGKTIAYKVAVPSPVNTTYPIILQITAPIDVGWAGLAWGGSMINNPLTASWANGAGATISSRYTVGHSAPPVYAGATYEFIAKGTHVNRTHWQFTAKCTGCTSYTGASSRAVILNVNGNNRLAFAYSGTKPSNPASNTTSFPVHEVTNYWSHDFGAAKNPDFSALLVKNGLKGDVDW